MVVAAGVAIAVLVALAAPASAHSGGRVQLYVDRLGLHSAGGDAWEVSVVIVDADSGSPQPGFDVAAEATDEAGHRAGPVALPDQGAGRYTGPLTAAPGKWEVVIRAETLPGGLPGVPLRKVYSLVFEPGKDLAVGAPASRRSRSGGGLAVPLAAAGATAAVIGWFIRGRRRRSGLVAG
jgi:hypothetical protein